MSIDKENDKTVQVFVYGSLRKGMQNHYRLEEMGAKYMGYFKTNKTYYMVGLKSRAYPYITESQVSPDSLKTYITGEIYTINLSSLDHLDVLEGSPHNYIRRLEYFNGPKITSAYMYILENTELIDGIKKNFEKRFVNVPGGDWVAFNKDI